MNPDLIEEYVDSLPNIIRKLSVYINTIKPGSITHNELPLTESVVWTINENFFNNNGTYNKAEINKYNNYKSLVCLNQFCKLSNPSELEARITIENTDAKILNDYRRMITKKKNIHASRLKAVLDSKMRL